MRKIFVIGNLGRDPETRADKNGNQFTTFSVGVTSGSGDKKYTDWFNMICGGKTSDIARNYLKKGMKVYVEGAPSVKAYINKQGEEVATLNVNVFSIEFLDKKLNDNEGGNYVLPDIPENSYGGLTSDDVPF